MRGALIGLGFVFIAGAAEAAPIQPYMQDCVRQHPRQPSIAMGCYRIAIRAAAQTGQLSPQVVNNELRRLGEMDAAAADAYTEGLMGERRDPGCGPARPDGCSGCAVDADARPSFVWGAFSEPRDCEHWVRPRDIVGAPAQCLPPANMTHMLEAGYRRCVVQHGR